LLLAATVQSFAHMPFGLFRSQQNLLKLNTFMTQQQTFAEAKRKYSCFHSSTSE